LCKIGILNLQGCKGLANPEIYIGFHSFNTLRNGIPRVSLNGYLINNGNIIFNFAENRIYKNSYLENYGCITVHSLSIDTAIFGPIINKGNGKVIEDSNIEGTGFFLSNIQN
jgi:hypothetical protein